MTTPSDTQEQQSEGVRIFLFVALLVAVIVLTILFASGELRFGIGGPLVYIVYLLGGAFAAVLTFGLLSSWGHAGGQYAGINVRLGGAIVALALVTGGGGLYERYLHVSPTVDVRVAFYSRTRGVLENVSGRVDLLVSNQHMTQNVQGQGTVLFQGIAPHLLGQAVSVSLQSTDWEVTESPAALVGSEPNWVKIRRRSLYVPAKEAALTVAVEKVDLVNMAGDKSKRSMTIRLRVVNRTTGEIPLGSPARFEVLSRSGVPVKTLELPLDESERSVKRGTGTIILDEVVDAAVVDFALQTGWDTVIHLAYDADVEPDGPEFSTTPQPLSKVATQH